MTRKINFWDYINHIVLVSISITMLIPFLNILTFSLSPEYMNNQFGLHLFPTVIDLEGYRFALATKNLVNSFFVNVYQTVLGTMLHVLLCSMAGYVLSIERFPGKQLVIGYILITFVIPGSLMLIPGYLVFRNLGLVNSLNALIVSGMIGAFTVILARNYFLTIPASLAESAKLDGAGYFKIFLRVYLPLSAPGIATITLFHVIGRWNMFMEGILYITDERKQPLNVIVNTLIASNYTGALAMMKKSAIGKNLQAAAVIIALVPLILIYPYLQKYFVTGLILGSVKE